jgi:peptidylprolyl isomerase
MTDIVKIDDEVITTEGFIKLLKLSGRFDGLIEDILREKLIVHAAIRKGIEAPLEEIQEKSEQFRRVTGLHRAQDTVDYFDGIGLTMDDFEAFLTDSVYQEKMLAEVQGDTMIDEYFRLHSPRFDSVEVSHIVMDSEGKAKELLTILNEDPESFGEMAGEYSIAGSSSFGGKLGKVMRGALSGDVESKLFNASEGEIIGPFTSADGEQFEIFMVNSMTPAELDDETRSEIKRLLKDDWLAARAKEHRIEPL